MSKRTATSMRAASALGIYRAREAFMENDVTQATMFALGFLTGGSEAYLLGRLGVAATRFARPASKLIKPLVPRNVITKLTRNGAPSWTTVKNRYWKLVNKGKAPRKKALVILEDGTQVEKLVSKELHHIHGRGGTNPHRASNLEEYWPWEHAANDPNRFINYEFLKWID